MKKIPFSPPKMDKAIIDEVVATLNSGWITTGPRTKALEKEVEKLAQVPKVLCVNSCTGGLELMMRWLGIQEGDEVIIPAFTYCATANVVLHCGATPIMVDIKPDDLTIDIEAVKNAITTKTKAIVPVLKNAQDNGLLVIALDTPLEPITAADSTFATDNFKAGELGGAWVAAR